MEDRDPFDTVFLVAIMALNGVAFVIIAICYGQIYLSLGKETRHAHSTSTGEMSVAKKMALLVRCLILTYTNWLNLCFIIRFLQISPVGLPLLFLA